MENPELILGGIEIVYLVVGTLIATAAAVILTPKFDADARKGSETNIRSAEEPEDVVYGFTTKGGVLAYINGTGEDNTYLHQMLVLAGHECEHIGKIYFNAEEVEEGSVFEPPPPTGGGWANAILYKALLDQLRSERKADKGAAYADQSRLIRHLGSVDQLADPDAVAENPNWTDDHRIRGHAYLYVRLQYDQEVFTSFIPNITCEVFGKKDIKDPRDEQQRWTMNPALIIADILTTYLGVPWESIDDDALIVAANVCDEVVIRKDGTEEPRYTANGFFKLDGNWEDYLTPFITAMAGAVVEWGGIYYIHAGHWTEPELTITDADFMGPISRQISDTDQRRANAVKGKYIAPSSYDTPTEFPPVKDAIAIGEDGQMVNWLDIKLERVNTHTQAQRVASIALQENRRDETISVEVPLSVGLDVRPYQNVRLSSEIFGIDETYRIIEHQVSPGRGRNPVVAVALTLKRHDASVYDWNPATQEKDVQNASTNLPGQGSKNPRNITYSIWPFFNDADHKAADLIVNWNDPEDDFEAIEIEFEMEVECREQDTDNQTGGNQPGPWQTVTISETREIDPGVGTVTISVEDESLTDGPYEFQNHTITVARMRSRIDPMTWGPWLTPEVE